MFFCTCQCSLLNSFCLFVKAFHKQIAKSFCSPLLSLRYRHEFKSNELWSEIKLVLDTFAQPLTELFKVCIDIKIQISKANSNHVAFNCQNVLYGCTDDMLIVYFWLFLL